MKIVHFNSGLGNQIFQYMFFLYQKNMGHEVYGYYHRKWLQQHNGLEFHKVLDCQLPKSTWQSRAMALFCRVIHRIDFLNLFFCSDESYNPQAIYCSGYWQNRIYFEHLQKPKFRDFELGDRNREICKLMGKCMSVSVHIRRGDYMTTPIMADLCSTDYYKKALACVEEHISHPVYFVFSDDMEWAKKNITCSNVCYVDWNKGKMSFIDMYLMSQCKAHVIANSSFSFWGAYLSEAGVLDIYPSKWFESKPSPIIAPDNWVCI